MLECKAPVCSIFAAQSKRAKLAAVRDLLAPPELLLILDHAQHEVVHFGIVLMVSTEHLWKRQWAEREAALLVS